MDFFSEPEQAIQAFEAWSKLNVVIYDLEGALLLPHLWPEHIRHAQPCCLAVKSTGLRAKCSAFEREHLYAQIGNFPSGRTQICHAGLVEWVVPVSIEKRRALIIFAGQRMPGKGLKTFTRDPAPPSTHLPWNASTPLPPPVSEEESQIFLEGLRQLAARLQLWMVDAAKLLKQPLKRPTNTDLTTRRDYILQYIHVRHGEPINIADLAEELGLSPSRMAHVVKESCGKSFGEMLLEARLRSATTLLRHARLSVAEVALQCGFSDPSRFHKVFKERTGMTPITYRRHSREA